MGLTLGERYRHAIHGYLVVEPEPLSQFAIHLPPVQQPVPHPVIEDAPHWCLFSGSHSVLVRHKELSQSLSVNFQVFGHTADTQRGKAKVLFQPLHPSSVLLIARYG